MALALIRHRGMRLATHVCLLYGLTTGTFHSGPLSWARPQRKQPQPPEADRHIEMPQKIEQQTNCESQAVSELLRDLIALGWT